MAKSKGIDWDKQPLGMLSDAALAKRLGVTKQTVHLQRNVRGIKPFVPQHIIPPNVVVHKIAEENTLDWDKVGLGTMSDYDLAKQLGVSITRIKFERKKRNIPSYFAKPAQDSRAPKRIDWDSEDRLGKIPDTELARILNVTSTSVRSARMHRGIPGFYEQRAEPLFHTGGKVETSTKIVISEPVIEKVVPPPVETIFPVIITYRHVSLDTKILLINDPKDLPYGDSFRIVVKNATQRDFEVYSAGFKYDAV